MLDGWIYVYTCMSICMHAFKLLDKKAVTLPESALQRIGDLCWHALHRLREALRQPVQDTAGQTHQGVHTPCSGVCGPKYACMHLTMFMCRHACCQMSGHPLHIHQLCSKWDLKKASLPRCGQPSTALLWQTGES